MAVIVKSSIMAASPITIDVNWSPATHSLVWDFDYQKPRNLYLRLRNLDGELLYPPFILRHVNGDEKGLVIGGPNVLWSLGQGGVGPRIIDEEFLSGLNKLSNPLDPANPLDPPGLLWTVGDSIWVIGPGYAITSSIDEVFEDQLLLSEEPFRAVPGAEYESIVTVGRIPGYSVGRLRLRHVYTGGPFIHPDQLPPFSTWEASTGTNLSQHDILYDPDSDSFRVGPSAMPNLIPNGDFEDPSGIGSLNGWVSIQGNWFVQEGFTVGTSLASRATVRALGPSPEVEALLVSEEDGGPVAFLTRYGYLRPQQELMASVSDSDEIVDATMAFQSFVGLEETGELDSETLAKMSEDRCGFPDLVDNGRASWVYLGSKWEGVTTLLWHLVSPGPFGAGVAAGAIVQAFSQWEACDIPLTFVETAVEADAHIVMDFGPIDGPNQIAAFAFSPPGPGEPLTGTVKGNVLFDNAETWSVSIPTAGGAVDFIAVALHELGHSLGLNHSSNSSAVMWPYVVADRRTLDADDVVGIETIYASDELPSGLPHFMMTDTSAPLAWKEIASSADGATSGPVVARNVIPHEEYEMWVLARTNPNFGDDTDGEAFMLAGLGGMGTADTFVETPHAKPDDSHGDWRLLHTKLTIPDDKTGLVPQIQVQNQTAGQWDFDKATLIRTKGNLDFITSPIFAITPGRSYKWTQPVQTDAGVREGTVSLAMVCFVATRPEVILQGPSIRVTGGATEIVEWEFTPPSGMDVCLARIVCQDVIGGSVHFPNDGASIRQSDTSKVVYETIGPLTAPTNVTLTLAAPAPAGAKAIHVELVAEAYGVGWVASGFTLVRTTADPATGAAVVTSLLRDPLTGEALSVGLGTVDAPLVIPNDIRFVNVTPREGLDRVCNVVYPGGLEYLVTSEIAPKLNVGQAVDLFVDHHPDGPQPVVLLGGMIKDPDVDEIESPETDTSERATRIVVIGSTLQLVSGGTLLVTAWADVPGPVERDLNNRPIVRSRYVSASTASHFAYAQALANDLALLEAYPPLSVPISLTEISDEQAAVLGVDPRPYYVVGDWIYVDKPEAGLRDLANPVTIEGVQYSPRRVRVLEEERSFSEGILELVEPDGTVTELAVQWGPSERRLTVGDRLLSWQADPEGKEEGMQYLDDRRTEPR